MIYHETVCWVRVCEGGEVAEEGVFAIVVFDYIACYASLDEDREEEGEHRGVLVGLFRWLWVDSEAVVRRFSRPCSCVELIRD